MAADAVLLADPPIRSLDAYLAEGGGDGLRTALGLGPGATIQEVTLSGLRGRGGAGFPTGRKWLSVRGEGPDDGAGDRYVVCNGAEGEPGTFKDRAILRANPYQVVEGVAIAAHAVGAVQAFIGVKASFAPEVEALSRALVEMADAGLAGDAPITLVSGPEEYLFGEETGLLQVIEGDAPLPRPVRDHAQRGLVGAAEAHRQRSHDRVRQRQPDPGQQRRDPGDGHARAAARRRVAPRARHRALPGPCRRDRRGRRRARRRGRARDGQAAARGDRARRRQRFKAVLSGVANPVLTEEHLDTPVSYEAMEAIGSGLGSCGFIVYDDTTSAVELARVVSRFLYVESCGQCPPCKLGTGQITDLLDGMLAGEPDPDAIELLGVRLRTVTDGNRCYLPVQEQRVVASLLRAFPLEFAAAADGVAPHQRGLVVPKLTDVAGGVAVVDERQPRKQPDWTYA
jgi:NADH:ubiquinone oxidoreductase subunit F (NADH-binding)